MSDLSKIPHAVDVQELREYFMTLSSLLDTTEVTAADGETCDLHAAINQLMAQARAVTVNGRS